MSPGLLEQDSLASNFIKQKKANEVLILLATSV
jgi:hypothetical protein